MLEGYFETQEYVLTIEEEQETSDAWNTLQDSIFSTGASGNNHDRQEELFQPGPSEYHTSSAGPSTPDPYFQWESTQDRDDPTFGTDMDPIETLVITEAVKLAFQLGRYALDEVNTKRKGEKVKERYRREQEARDKKHQEDLERERRAAKEAEEKLKAEKEEEIEKSEARTKAAQQAAQQEKEKHEREIQEQERKNEEEKEKLREVCNKMESQVNSGIQPVQFPTSEERSAAEKTLLQPRSNFVHCAVAGLRGSGKSSLINALRGIRDNHPLAARTGTSETTHHITPYPHPTPGQPLSNIVWYDVPGAGTINHKGWQYFNRKGLFVFDLILVIPDAGLSEKDLDILEHCQRYKIPSLLVRSKADQHIRNSIEDEALSDVDEDDDVSDYEEHRIEKTREKYIRTTREAYRNTLSQRPDLNPAKKVYIVSKTALCAKSKGTKGRLKGHSQLIDEGELLEVLAAEALRVISKSEVLDKTESDGE